MTEHQDVTAAGLDKSLNTFENAVDTKLVAAADLIEERADEMLAKASKLSKRVGGGAKGLFGRAKAAAADKMATAAAPAPATPATIAHSRRIVPLCTTAAKNWNYLQVSPSRTLG